MSTFDPYAAAFRGYSASARTLASNQYNLLKTHTITDEEHVPFGSNTGWLFGLIGGIIIATLLIPMQFSDLVRYGKSQCKTVCGGSGGSGDDDDDPKKKMTTATILGFVTLGTAGLIIVISFWILFHLDGIPPVEVQGDDQQPRWRPVTMPALILVIAFFCLALTYGIMYAIQKPVDASGDDGDDDGDDDGGKFQNWHAGFGGATAGVAGLLAVGMIGAFYKFKTP